jgi:hypothetical protein
MGNRGSAEIAGQLTGGDVLNSPKQRVDMNSNSPLIMFQAYNRRNGAIRNRFI